MLYYTVLTDVCINCHYFIRLLHCLNSSFIVKNILYKVLILFYRMFYTTYLYLVLLFMIWLLRTRSFSVIITLQFRLFSFSLNYFSGFYLNTTFIIRHSVNDGCFNQRLFSIYDKWHVQKCRKHIQPKHTCMQKLNMSSILSVIMHT